MAYSIPLSGPALIYYSLNPMENSVEDTFGPWKFLGVSERGVNVSFTTAEEDAMTDLGGVPYEVIHMGVSAMITCVMKIINNLVVEQDALSEWVLGRPATDSVITHNNQYPHSRTADSIGLLHKANSSQPNCLRAFQLAIVNSYRTPQELNGFIFYCVIPERMTWNYRYSQLGVPASWRAYPKLKYIAQPPYEVTAEHGGTQQDIEYWRIMKRITNEQFPIPDFAHV